ncbi:MULTISPECIES: bifunctional 2-polyprenyl-6-hydroxyphenol methylase/3-demethylubiquinol 3-O-methyltransferase UbiG [unclassified Anabaena]|uniref:class I SAM-dependent methyltransferase n=1 Tax=unclassified Anabaena TaxID=2619674 RepID=UPI000830C9BB|nr:MULTISPECIES: class I SAM-dependent methyltransferase [unclassified Anabaena]
MIKNLIGDYSNLSLLNPRNDSSLDTNNNQQKRIKCSICDYCVDETDESAFTTFFCNVRAFHHEKFPVWRCPQCQSIHCLDVVELSHYYAKYPFTQAVMTWTLKILYKNLRQQLSQHGFSQHHSFLDYGCGTGLFVRYLQQQNFTNCYGYDPYAPKENFGDAKILEKGPFDYILLQDVIEHVEEPSALLSELDSLLAPGGYILIGTPNAANIDLSQPHISDFYNSVHVPYHLHIYTRSVLESLGMNQGWKPVDFFDRAFHDTPWFGLNTRAWNEYQRLLDGTINVVFQPIQLKKALSSRKFIYYAIFGYWLSLHTEMAIMFRKT